MSALPTILVVDDEVRSVTSGAHEQALIVAPLREAESDPVAVQHIVRSFDPCMVCTVH